MGDRLSDVRWHNNGRGPRVVFQLGGEEVMVTADRAIELGTALLNAGLEATGQETVTHALEVATEHIEDCRTALHDDVLAVRTLNSALSKILKDGT
jgi:hypothetical protein